MVEEQLVDAWQIHNRIMVYVLDAVAPAAIGSRLAGKGRSVGEQFAHLHNVRLMWLRSAAPELLTGLTKIEKAEAIDKEHLHAALTASGEAIAALLRQVLGHRRQNQGLQAARLRLPRLPGRPRVVPPGRDWSHPRPGRPPSRQEGGLRHVGVGRPLRLALNAPARCI